MPSTLELYRSLVIRMVREYEMLDNVMVGYSPWGHGPAELSDKTRLLHTMRDTRSQAEEILKQDVIEVQTQLLEGE